jgi:hypothetical protein
MIRESLSPCPGATVKHCLKQIYTLVQFIVYRHFLGNPQNLRAPKTGKSSEEQGRVSARFSAQEFGLLNGQILVGTAIAEGKV